MNQMPTKDDFRREVKRQIDEGRNGGAEYVDIKSGDVHRALGGYPSKNHRMSSCCEAMYDYMKRIDVVLEEPPEGKGATLRIRYFT